MSGTVFVNVTRHGEWLGSWQDGPHCVDTAGTEAEVMAWAGAQPADKVVVFNGDDYVEQ